MTLSRNTVVNFKDVPNSPAVRTFIEERCEQLAEEFPEELCFEVTIIPEGDGFTAHGHVTGRDIDVAANHDWENETNDSYCIHHHSVFQYSFCGNPSVI